MRMKYLLGATKDKEIVFGEFGLRYNGEFSASFDTVRPFNADEVDKRELAESYLDCLDKATLYDMCDDYNCSPSDLPDEIVYAYDIQNLIDCSLYDETIYVNNNNWMFESGACGQHDARQDMEVYVDKKAFDLLYDCWDKYHLEPIPEDVLNNLIETIDASCVDEREWIAKYISDTF